MEESTMSATLDAIRGIIEQNMASEARDLAVYKKVETIVATFAGKPATKHVANAIAKTYPGWYVRWVPEFSWKSIHVYEEGEGSTYKVSLMLAYDSEPAIDMEKFADHNASNGKAAEERNKLRAAMLADPVKLQAMADAVDSYKVAVAAMEAAVHYPNPDEYAIEKLAYGDKRQ
jgi:hypothetical protein